MKDYQHSAYSGGGAVKERREGEGRGGEGRREGEGGEEKESNQLHHLRAPISTDHDGDGAEGEVELEVFVEVLAQLSTSHHIA